MQRSRPYASLLVMSVLMLSGCGSVDPWSLLPSSEQVFLEMAARPNVSAQPITVEELLMRAKGDVDAIADQSSEPTSEPNQAKVSLSAPEDVLTADLDFVLDAFRPDGTLQMPDSLDPIRDLITADPSLTVVIEVPAKPLDSRIAAFRRAAAVARYFEKVAKQVRVLPVTDIDANSLRVGLERDI